MKNRDKRKLLIAIVPLFLALWVPFLALAEQNTDYTPIFTAEEVHKFNEHFAEGLLTQPRYLDEVGLLTRLEAQQLIARLDEISEQQHFDVVIGVVDDFDYRALDVFALDFFEENGFGFGENGDGAILLLAMAERDRAFVAVGFGEYAFTTRGLDYLDKLFLPDLKTGHYYLAFMAFADAVDDFLDMAKLGEPYDSGNIPLLPWERVRNRNRAIGGSLLLALIIALVMVQIEKGKLRSVKEQKFAHEYIRTGSMVVNTSRDIFLYRNVVRHKKEEKESGSRSVTSSSGRSGTSRTGKF